MIALFFASLLSLIIYQLRSILWLKANYSKNRLPKHQNNIELLNLDEQRANYVNSKVRDDAIPRVLSM